MATQQVSNMVPRKDFSPVVKRWEFLFKTSCINSTRLCWYLVIPKGLVFASSTTRRACPHKELKTWIFLQYFSSHDSSSLHSIWIGIMARESLGIEVMLPWKTNIRNKSHDYKQTRDIIKKILGELDNQNVQS